MIFGTLKKGERRNGRKRKKKELRRSYKFGKELNACLNNFIHWGNDILFHLTENNPLQQPYFGIQLLESIHEDFGSFEEIEDATLILPFNHKVIALGVISRGNFQNIIFKNHVGIKEQRPSQASKGGTLKNTI